MKINKNNAISTFLICLSLALFYKPEAYVIGQRFYNYVSYFTILLCAFVIARGVFYCAYGKYRISCPVLAFIAVYAWCLGVSSVMNSFVEHPISNVASFVFLANTISFVLICDFETHRNPERLLLCIVIVGGFMCTLNAYTMFHYGYNGGMNSQTKYFGNWLSENYFLLGEDNSTYYLTWPTMIVTWCYYLRFNRKRLSLIWAIVFTAVNVMAYIYLWSIVASIACISVAVSLVFYISKINRDKSEKMRKKRHLTWHSEFSAYWIFGLGFNILMAHQRITKYIGSIGAAYFSKSATLSNRTKIWELSWQHILRSFLVGYGNETNEYTISKIILNHTHNLYLETLYRGGIIGLVLLIIAFILLANKLRGVQNGIVSWLQFMVFLFLICTSMDFAFYRYHYLIIVVLLSRSYIFTDKKNKINNWKSIEQFIDGYNILSKSTKT